MTARSGRTLGLLLAMSAALGAAPAYAATTITLLRVNDTHSRVLAWGPKDANLDGTVGGLGKAATIIYSEKLADPEAVFVHAGDVFNGDLFFPRRAARDTPIGNLLTDAYRAATGTDIAVEATGFIEDGIISGPVVGADVFHVMPYGFPEVGEFGLLVRPFNLATFKISGAGLLLGVEFGLANRDMFLQVSGLRFKYDSRLAAFERVIGKSVHVGGRRLEPDQLYSVTANEGVLFFLPQLGIEVSDISVLPVTAWSAASARIEALGVLEPVVQNRIRDEAVGGN